MMTRFIKLTDLRAGRDKEKPIWASVERIISLRESNMGTTWVIVNGESFPVRETPDEILKLIKQGEN